MAWEMGLWPCLSGIMVVKLTEVGDSFQLWVRPFLDETLGLYNMVKGSCARQPEWLCFPPIMGAMWPVTPSSCSLGFLLWRTPRFR